MTKVATQAIDALDTPYLDDVMVYTKDTTLRQAQGLEDVNGVNGELHYVFEPCQRDVIKRMIDGTYMNSMPHLDDVMVCEKARSKFHRKWKKNLICRLMKKRGKRRRCCRSEVRGDVNPMDDMYELLSESSGWWEESVLVTAMMDRGRSMDAALE